ncbi:MAG: PEGA domain-containing protein [Rikenellaceae bacterium]|jgi:uncharacterized protein YceK|nr:PEGA domain-containing protein [Rikenellaceae bacterium]
MKKLFLLLIVAAVSNGCATIISGSTQRVDVMSSPAGAAVYDNGMLVGQTPLAAWLPRSRDHQIILELQGYQPYIFHITRTFNAWAIGNILFGGLIGIIVDLATGAVYTLSPDRIDARFGSHVSPFSTVERRKNGLVVAVTMVKDRDGLQQIGTLQPI